MSNTNDLRVIRTRKMIIQAFVKLIAENGYESVTIQQIADTAMINRSTFYAHFKDKDDLYDQIFQEILAPFVFLREGPIITPDNQVRLQTVEHLLGMILTTVWDNRDLYVLIFDGGQSSRLFSRLQALAKVSVETLFDRLGIGNDAAIPRDLIYTYIVSIFVGTTTWWLHSDGEFTPAQLARLLVKLVQTGYLNVLGIRGVDE